MVVSTGRKCLIGHLYVFQTRSMGNCLFHAFKGCLKVRTWADNLPPYFPCRYVRRMVVSWMAHNRSFVWKLKSASLRSKYGVENGDYVDHPLSYKDYLRNMLKRSFWGEDVVIYSLACLFDLKITVLNSRRLEEYRFRHNLPLHSADVVLVYNGNNHYLYAGEYDWTFVYILVGVSIGR